MSYVDLVDADVCNLANSFFSSIEASFQASYPRLILVVHVLGWKVGFKRLEAKLHRDWEKEGKIRITDLPCNFYVVQFTSLVDYKLALYDGLWLIADHCILVQRWHPMFMENWVRIPSLPLELCNDVFLRRVGEKLGKFRKVDCLTSIHSRGLLVRVCIEL